MEIYSDFGIFKIVYILYVLNVIRISETQTMHVQNSTYCRRVVSMIKVVAEIHFSFYVYSTGGSQMQGSYQGHK